MPAHVVIELTSPACPPCQAAIFPFWSLIPALGITALIAPVVGFLYTASGYVAVPWTPNCAGIPAVLGTVLASLVLIPVGHLADLDAADAMEREAVSSTPLVGYLLIWPPVVFALGLLGVHFGHRYGRKVTGADEAGAPRVPFWEPVRSFRAVLRDIAQAPDLR